MAHLNPGQFAGVIERSVRRSSILFAAFAAIVSVIALSATPPSAQAATRSMTGFLMVDNIDAGIEGGPGIFGAPVGGRPPNEGFKTISVDGATPGTFVGRAVTIDANKLDFEGAARAGRPPQAAAIACFELQFPTSRAARISVERFSCCATSQ